MADCEAFSSAHFLYILTKFEKHTFLYLMLIVKKINSSAESNNNSDVIIVFSQ